MNKQWSDFDKPIVGCGLVDDEPKTEQTNSDIKKKYCNDLRRNCKLMGIEVLEIEQEYDNTMFCFPILDLGKGWKVRFQGDVNRFKEKGWKSIYAPELISPTGHKESIRYMAIDEQWEFVQDFAIVWRRRFEVMFEKIDALRKMISRIEGVIYNVREEVYAEPKDSTDLEFLRCMEEVRSKLLTKGE